MWYPPLSIKPCSFNIQIHLLFLHSGLWFSSCVFWPMSPRCAPTFSFIGFMILSFTFGLLIWYLPSYMMLHEDPALFCPYEESVFPPTSAKLHSFLLWPLVPAFLYIRFAYLSSVSQLFISLVYLFLCSDLSGFNMMALRLVFVCGSLSLLSLLSI